MAERISSVNACRSASAIFQTSVSFGISVSRVFCCSRFCLYVAKAFFTVAMKVFRSTRRSLAIFQSLSSASAFANQSGSQKLPREVANQEEKHR